MWAWLHTDLAAPVQGSLIISDTGVLDFQSRPSLDGSRRKYPSSGIRRIDLLAYMWGFATARQCLFALLLTATLALVGAALLFPGYSPAPQVRPILTGTATGLLLFGLGLMYALAAPPLQAPDEPNHFLGILYTLDNRRHDDEVLRWAQRGHFERLRFHPSQHFHTTDIGNPEATMWRDMPPTWPSTRTAWTGCGGPSAGGQLSGMVATCDAADVADHTRRAVFDRWGERRRTRQCNRANRRRVAIGGAAVVRTVGAVLRDAHLQPRAGDSRLRVHRNFVRARVPSRPKTGAIAGGMLGTGFVIALGATRSAAPLLPLIVAVLSMWMVSGNDEGPTSTSQRQLAVRFWLGAALALFGPLAMTAYSTTAVGPQPPVPSCSRRCYVQSSHLR